MSEISKTEKTEQTKGILRWAALFLGELRDGLTMVRSFSQSSILPVDIQFVELSTKNLVL